MTGIEHLAAYDMRTGEWLAHAAGDGDRFVAFPPSLLRELRDPRRSVALHHNHPSGTSLSHADVAAVAELPGLHWAVAHGHDGSFYAARVERSANELTRWNTVAVAALRSEFDDAVLRGDLPLRIARAHFRHGVNLVLARCGTLEYRARLSPRRRQGLAPFRTDLSRRRGVDRRKARGVNCRLDPEARMPELQRVSVN